MTVQAMAERLAQLEARGFDKSRETDEGHVRVGCSQCAALVINGVASHETGCPNARRIRRGDDLNEEGDA
jgi:hypothetical protein